MPANLAKMMEKAPKRISCHIGRRADKEGARLSAQNQADIKKYATEQNLPESNVVENFH